MGVTMGECEQPVLPSARKENTQCVLYSDPGQRVLYAFFKGFFFLRNFFAFFYLPNVRIFYSDPPPHIFLPPFFCGAQHSTAHATARRAPLKGAAAPIAPARSASASHRAQPLARPARPAAGGGPRQSELARALVAHHVEEYLHDRGARGELVVHAVLGALGPRGRREPRVEQLPAERPQPARDEVGERARARVCDVGLAEAVHLHRPILSTELVTIRSDVISLQLSTVSKH